MMPTMSDDIIANAVREYWETSIPRDVVVFFSQKYDSESKWERCEEVALCYASDDYSTVQFLSDFCEGQTCVKDVTIVPLTDVISYYYDNKMRGDKSQ
jgi:hypothetical protein